MKGMSKKTCKLGKSEPEEGLKGQGGREIAASSLVAASASPVASS